MLKKQLEENASKNDSKNIVLNEHTSNQQIRNLSKKFNNSHDFSIPKK